MQLPKSWPVRRTNIAQYRYRFDFFSISPVLPLARAIFSRRLFRERKLARKKCEKLCSLAGLRLVHVRIVVAAIASRSSCHSMTTETSRVPGTHKKKEFVRELFWQRTFS